MPTPTYDMSAPDTQRRPSNRYIEYLHMYTRRLRLSAPGPAKDGAGLICGSGLHGRATPLKGKGMPPPDNKEADFNAGGIRMVPGVWCHHADTDVLNARRPITAADLAFRPSVRYFASAFASSMKGAAAVVVQEEPEKRMVRRRGAQAPLDGVVHTKRRVHADSDEATSLDWWDSPRSSTRSWQLPSRPVTADSIIRHRYSDPSSDPSPAKLNTARNAGPTQSKPTPEASRAVFNTALDGYCANKGRAHYGSTFRLG